MSTKNPALDRAFGARVRFARIAAKISQGTLGEELGVSFQQVQKYELGKDRISASQLLCIARALEKPISFFYEDMGDPGDHGPEADISLASIVDRRGRDRRDMSLDVTLIRTLARIDDAPIKRCLLSLAKAIADAVSPTSTEVPAPLQQAAE